MSDNNDVLREAARKLLSKLSDSPDYDTDLAIVMEALAASKPEPQAQAGEPEVVALVDSHLPGGIGWGTPGGSLEPLPDGTELITLQSHREAIAASNPAKIIELLDEIDELRAKLKVLEEQKPAGVYCVSYYKGIKSMGNAEFQPMASFSEGEYNLYLAAGAKP